MRARAIAVAVPLVAPRPGVVSDPPPGKFYHGVYPGGPGGMGSDITPQAVAVYAAGAGKHNGIDPPGGDARRAPALAAVFRKYVGRDEAVVAGPCSDVWQ